MWLGFGLSVILIVFGRVAKTLSRKYSGTVLSNAISIKSIKALKMLVKLTLGHLGVKIKDGSVCFPFLLFVDLNQRTWFTHVSLWNTKIYFSPLVSHRTIKKSSCSFSLTLFTFCFNGDITNLIDDHFWKSTTN